MKELVRFSPFKGMRQLRDEIDRLFDSNFSTFGENSLGGWSPNVDIHEDADRLSFTVELPGIKKDNIKVDVENNILTISGERKFESEDQSKNYHRVERSYGCFRRSFGLPATIDPDTADASYKDGLLTIEFDKRAEVKGREIEIK